MPSLPVLPSRSASTFEEAVEDDEMVFKRARKDGVNKHNKLKVLSRQRRIASIPSRYTEAGSLSTHVKGSASIQSSMQRGHEQGGEEGPRAGFATVVGRVSVLKHD